MSAWTNLGRVTGTLPSLSFKRLTITFAWCIGTETTGDHGWCVGGGAVCRVACASSVRFATSSLR